MKYDKTTNNVNIQIKPTYQNDLSSGDDSGHIWQYLVSIENTGVETIKLLKRNWVAIDSEGTYQKNESLGIVGDQPIIEPGEKFNYQGQIELDSSSGVMIGDYEVLNLSNNEIENIKIPSFSLDHPNEKFILN